MKYTEITKVLSFVGRLVEATTQYRYMAGQPFDLAQDLRRPALHFGTGLWQVSDPPYIFPEHPLSKLLNHV